MSAQRHMMLYVRELLKGHGEQSKRVMLYPESDRDGPEGGS